MKTDWTQCKIVMTPWLKEQLANPTTIAGILAGMAYYQARLRGATVKESDGEV